MNLSIKNRFTSELPADKNEANYYRQVHGSCFSYVIPRIPSNPSLIHTSLDVAKMIGLNSETILTEDFTTVFSGKKIFPNTKPYAMCYAGHQFGNWAGQLGDGRAINLTEIEHDNDFYTLQLKGAGKTPYSRNADGLAVLRSSVREYLCSEAMFYLGVPTTRSLSLMLTGDEVLRDVLYNGNPSYEKGAVICRVAPSFIRFGSFEFFAANNDLDNLKLLADYTIEHYFSEILEKETNKYLSFFENIINKTLEMIIHWQRIGFVHGVMNTDNMSIHGLTIDYGPYGWMDDYNQNWTPNTTDNEHKRYRFGNQPNVALWNLYQLANALYPLIEDSKPLEKILNSFSKKYEIDYLEMMCKKLGLSSLKKSDLKLISELEKNLQLSETDMTIFFRELSNVKKSYSPGCGISIINNAFYNPKEINKTILKSWEKWFVKYIERLNIETIDDTSRKQNMDAINPKYVLRNYMAQIAIDEADKGNYVIIDELYQLLKKPYDEQIEHEKWYAKRPDWAKDKIGCSMLSCSS